MYENLLWVSILVLQHSHLSYHHQPLTVGGWTGRLSPAHGYHWSLFSVCSHSICMLPEIPDQAHYSTLHNYLLPLFWKFFGNYRPLFNAIQHQLHTELYCFLVYVSTILTILLQYYTANATYGLSLLPSPVLGILAILANRFEQLSIPLTNTGIDQLTSLDTNGSTNRKELPKIYL